MGTDLDGVLIGRVRTYPTGEEVSVINWFEAAFIEPELANNVVGRSLTGVSNLKNDVRVVMLGKAYTQGLVG